MLHILIKIGLLVIFCCLKLGIYEKYYFNLQTQSYLNEFICKDNMTIILQNHILNATFITYGWTF